MRSGAISLQLHWQVDLDTRRDTAYKPGETAQHNITQLPDEYNTELFTVLPTNPLLTLTPTKTLFISRLAQDRRKAITRTLTLQDRLHSQ